MTREMPVRNWKNLPEARLIDGLVRDCRRCDPWKPAREQGFSDFVADLWRVARALED